MQAINKGFREDIQLLLRQHLDECDGGVQVSEHVGELRPRQHLHKHRDQPLQTQIPGCHPSQDQMILIN